ncbi:SMI1/KNR4 family protein [Streptomyces sp. NPDC056061]|uniref:SMI1/KNR4 family protein n=1 Tax=Streptomyces sp. NPDC056061 TaxID=3345700 RepID=UPI0035D79FC8
MSSIHDFATWEPLLRLLRDGNAQKLAAPDGYVAGQISRDSWSMPLRRPSPPPGRAAQVEDVQAEYDAVGRVCDALGEGADDDGVSFMVEIAPTGRTVLHLLGSGPAAQFGLGPYPGSLLLVEDAVPEPWRRLPEPSPGAAPAPTADPALLERTLRERLPDAIGATEEEIAAAEERLGVTLPEELRALYRVTRARWEDWGDDHEAAEREAQAVGCELLPPDRVYVADARSRRCFWEFGAMEAVITPPDAKVQGLVGSPGWIAFGDNGGGDRLAIDLTPGPRGHLGQVIMLSHEEDTGAEPIADSLTDLVMGRLAEGREHHDEFPAVARVNVRALPSVEAAAHPDLEVLSIGAWEDEPVSLAPVIGLPRLRTLSACAGTLADPLEIAGLTGLEFLELGPEDWRVLLDAGAVPHGLSAAAIEVRGDQHPLRIADLADEILALGNRPAIPRTVVEGDLGPAL